MIQLIEVSRHYGAFVAVDRVSFEVTRGELVGYLGPNGAGKSTTVKMMAGIIPPTTGEILLDGKPLLVESMEAKQRIGYVPETAGLYESLTGYEFLQLIGRLYHLEEDLIAYKIGEFLKLFGLETFMHQRMSGYSKGMKQKVLISAALIHNPDLLFFDEPLSGLDANTMLVFKELLRQLAAQGKTIFYCSHILDVVERICHRAIIVDHGRIVADAPVAELKAMTEQGSLEDVFKKLTDASDAEAIAREFRAVVTGTK